MAKFYGAIGYAVSEETTPGVWKDTIIERPYTGDIVTNSRNWRQIGNVNPDLTISDTISIIADGFSLSGNSEMKYVNWRGSLWEIANVIIERPRVILTLGGLYNGQEA